jgi:hypothetical protein
MRVRSQSDQRIQPTPPVKIFVNLTGARLCLPGKAHHERRKSHAKSGRFANVPTTSGSPVVNPRARRTTIGSMLNAKFSRPQLKPQAATLPPQCLPTRDRLRRNPVNGLPDSLSALIQINDIQQRRRESGERQQGRGYGYAERISLMYGREHAGSRGLPQGALRIIQTARAPQSAAPLVIFGTRAILPCSRIRRPRWTGHNFHPH